MSDTDEELLVDLARFDWITTPSGEKLHALLAGLIDVENWWFTDIATQCGRVADYGYIPGVFTRMGAERCKRCCDVLGYPHGVGSPKNDPACKAALDAKEKP